MISKQPRPIHNQTGTPSSVAMIFEKQFVLFINILIALERKLNLFSSVQRISDSAELSLSPPVCLMCSGVHSGSGAGLILSGAIIGRELRVQRTEALGDREPNQTVACNPWLALVIQVFSGHFDIFQGQTQQAAILGCCYDPTVPGPVCSPHSVKVHSSLKGTYC